MFGWSRKPTPKPEPLTYRVILRQGLAARISAQAAINDAAWYAAGGTRN